MRSDWTDLSYPIGEGITTWPGHPALKLEKLHDMESGSMANVSVLSLCLHTGTHMDAPLHFIEGGQDMASIPLDIRTGATRIIEVKGDRIRPEDIGNFEELYGPIEAGERVFFKTEMSNEDWTFRPFMEDYVYFTTDAVNYLLGKGISVLGIDYLSVGNERNNLHIHRQLLSYPVWIIEGLDMRNVTKGLYEAVISPMKIINGDGSPVSVLVRPVKDFN